jgi:hypothetical protein
MMSATVYRQRRRTAALSLPPTAYRLPPEDETPRGLDAVLVDGHDVGAEHRAHCRAVLETMRAAERAQEERLRPRRRKSALWW